jgi:DNA-binding PadR family transcriptional regulator
VNELTSKVFDTGAVFISLDRLERGRLISRKVQSSEESDGPKVVFNVTAEGERMLGEVRVAAMQLADALKDFA